MWYKGKPQLQTLIIIGIHIPNQRNQVKLSQCADDPNFFVLKFFQNVNKATGTTVNLEKTTVLPINTDDTEQIPKITLQITIKEQFETIKIIGIYFNENLKNASLTNWDIILDKMEKHINKLSPRILTLYGKTILINTLILSKASYLSNVFPVDAEIAHKINNKIFKYLWNNKVKTHSKKNNSLKTQTWRIKSDRTRSPQLRSENKTLIDLK